MVRNVLRQRIQKLSLISLDPARVQIHRCHSESFSYLCGVSSVYFVAPKPKDKQHMSPGRCSVRVSVEKRPLEKSFALRTLFSKFSRSV